MFYRIAKQLVLLIALQFSLMTVASAEDRVQPFVLAQNGSGELNTMVDETKQKLTAAGFQVLGSYAPYDNAEVIVVTNEELKNVATKSVRGGYGAVERVAVTKNGNTIEVTYTNPIYWANAYRMSSSLDDISAKLASALGKIKEYGSGDKKLSAKDMRSYHYTFMMEYFDDPSKLNNLKSHADAVAMVNKNLAKGAGASKKVYQLDLGKDTEGKQMTLFGVGLSGKNSEDCSGDNYIMSRVDKSTPRHTAHLPYEILVYGNKVEALFARFRIAVSWPYLPMVASSTGATFFSIMCAPNSIEDALRKVAGGVDEDF